MVATKMPANWYTTRTNCDRRWDDRPKDGRSDVEGLLPIGRACRDLLLVDVDSAELQRFEREGAPRLSAEVAERCLRLVSVVLGKLARLAFEF